MKYSIEFKKSAAKSLRKLPNSAKKRILTKLSSFENSPPPITETKLKGNNPFHKIRVDDYRIIYEYQGEILVILIIKIGHRKDIYNKLP